MIKIAITGFIGYEVAAGLFRQHQKELEQRFGRSFLRSFEKLSEQQGEEKEFFVSDKEGQPAFLALLLDKGGLFGTLWKACDQWQMLEESSHSPVGCRIYLDAVPIKQEVVELTELYEENPYELESTGALLLVWNEDTESELPEECSQLIKKAAVIGKITKEKERILIQEDAVRYLTPPSRQQKDIKDRKKTKITDREQEV